MLWRTLLIEKLETADLWQKAIGQIGDKLQADNVNYFNKASLCLETGPSLHKTDPRCTEYSEVEAVLRLFPVLDD